MKRPPRSPDELLLTPDAPSRPDSKRKPTVLFAKKRKKPEKPPRSRRPKPEKYTLAEAFDFLFNVGTDTMGVLNFERAIRAVSFLLQWCSETGNEDVQGHIANGLGYILEHTAGQFHYIRADYEREIDDLKDKVRRIEGDK
jgi:hypothetical protein